jgi:lipid II:glycine glycyltransferase (peptidoglycan interpeptide bridge formation enzyme)
VLSLEGDEQDVLQRMKSKWRYNVRLAERKGVVVRSLRRDELPAFQRLMADTGRRDGFALHSPDYYAAAYDLMTPGLGAFLAAEYAGELLGAIVVTACGPAAWYVWGASGNRERQRMPNHALQWAGMQWARARGALRYDLWGIPDEMGLLGLGLCNGEGCGAPVEAMPVDLEQLPDEGLWGVYRFKQGFGGAVVRHVGTWDKPLRPGGARLFHLGLDLRDRAQAVRAGFLRSVNGVDRELYAVDSPEAWRAALGGLPAVHVLQSWEWGAVKAQTGWRADRMIMAQPDGKAAAAFQFLWRPLAARIPLAVGYVPKGPVVDWDDTRLVEAVLAQIEAHARRRGCIFVKIDPDVREYSAAGIRLRHALRCRGWRFSADQIQFKNTGLTDLQPGEEALLTQMKSKWRYNIRLAERRGIRVRQGGLDDLARFYALYEETGRRDGFLIRPFEYYRTTWATFLQAEAAPVNPAGGALLLAEHPGEQEPVAGLFLLRYGERAWYFYGASSERQRRDMPNYLLQWEALRWSLAQGCTVYDWWGAPTDPDDPDDGLQGVWQFKQGFGAQFADHVGAWDFPVSLPLYRAYTEIVPRGLGLLRRVRQGLAAQQSGGG